MYLGVDVGGTKTLVAVLNGHGEIIEKTRFPTPKNYAHWLLELEHALIHFQHHDFKAGGIGLPGRIDRQHGRAVRLSNLPQWGQDRPVQRDVERIAGCPIVIENDARLAGLSEAMLIKNHAKVLYVTISTGIGAALIVNQAIDTNLSSLGGRSVIVEHRGRRASWESFASGRAIVGRYGKQAAELTDAAAWRAISRDLAKGLIELIAITEPEVVVIGGGVGAHFERFGQTLAAELKKYHLPLVPIPPLRKAQRPEEAVIFGCYDLAKQVFAHDHEPTAA